MDVEPAPALAEPAEEPVPIGAEILEEIATFIARFVAYPHAHALIAHVLWLAHTHAMDAWDSTPRLAFLSPEPGSVRIPRERERSFHTMVNKVPREREQVSTRT